MIEVEWSDFLIKHVSLASIRHPLEQSSHNFIHFFFSFIGFITNWDMGGTTIGLLAKLIGHIALTIIASKEGWIIGPPAAIE